jgi:hypothetical protein
MRDCGIAGIRVRLVRERVQRMLASLEAWGKIEILRSCGKGE